MIPGRKLVRKHTLPRSHLSDQSKTESRFGTRNNSLPHLADPEAADFSKQSQIKAMRNTSGGSQSPTQSGTSVSFQAIRSVSVSKFKSKVNNMGKTTTGLKSRPTLRPDSASASKRHKKGGLSLQMASDTSSVLHHSFVASRDPNLYSPQSALARTVGVLQGDVSRLRSETPSMGRTVEADEEFDISDLEQVFLKALQGIPSSEVRTQLRVYHRFFSDVIRASGPLSSLLARFKEGYETLVEELQEKYTREVSRLQGEIITLQNGILQEAEDRKSLLKKIEKLSRENVEMSEACDTYEGKINDFQEKLYDIANVKMDEYPPTEEAWRLLNSELDYYKSWKQKIARELKISQAKEKKLIRLVHALKSRGYPVEEVYDAEVKTPVPSRQQSKEKDEDESLRLVSGRGKMLQKPDKIPSLNFETLEPYASSSHSSEESYISVSHEEVTLRKALSDSSTHMMTEELDRSHSSSHSKGQCAGKK